MRQRQRYPNELQQARRRLKFSRKLVGALIDKTASTIARYENGTLNPPFLTALQLEIVLRTPVAFLFPSLYGDLRIQIRSQEDRLARFRNRRDDLFQGGLRA